MKSNFSPFQTIEDTDLSVFVNSTISELPPFYEVAWFAISYSLDGTTTRKLECSYNQANDMFLAVMERAAYHPHEPVALGSIFWNHVGLWAKMLRKGSTGGHADRPEFVKF
jgi:hypothetical protein